MTTTKEARIALGGAIDRAENKRLRAALGQALDRLNLVEEYRRGKGCTPPQVEAAIAFARAALKETDHDR